jgi:hypothetical protein
LLSTAHFQVPFHPIGVVQGRPQGINSPRIIYLLPSPRLTGSSFLLRIWMDPWNGIASLYLATSCNDLMVIVAFLCLTCARRASEELSDAPLHESLGSELAMTIDTKTDQIAGAWAWHLGFRAGIGSCGNSELLCLLFVCSLAIDERVVNIHPIHPRRRSCSPMARIALSPREPKEREG